MPKDKLSQKSRAKVKLRNKYLRQSACPDSGPLISRQLSFAGGRPSIRLPALAKMPDHLRTGDVVTITGLNRLARSTRDLLDIAEPLDVAEAGLKSLAEPCADTTSPAGRGVLTFFALTEADLAAVYRAAVRAGAMESVAFTSAPV